MKAILTALKGNRSQPVSSVPPRNRSFAIGWWHPTFARWVHKLGRVPTPYPNGACESTTMGSMAHNYPLQVNK
jgi:hypothetical protein